MDAARVPSILRPGDWSPIVFEPMSAGGGSFWNGDSLLATLTVLKRAERQGRLSLRDTNRAADIVPVAQKQHMHYRLIENLRQTGDAEWGVGESSARLRYRGREFLATPESLLSAQDLQPVIVRTLASDWDIQPMELRVAREADLPLVAFFLFVAYDLADISHLQRTPA
jgi:hypothetical protein